MSFLHSIHDEFEWMSQKAFLSHRVTRRGIPPSKNVLAPPPSLVGSLRFFRRHCHHLPVPPSAAGPPGGAWDRDRDRDRGRGQPIAGFSSYW